MNATKISRGLFACLLSVGLAFPATIEAHSKSGSSKTKHSTSKAKKSTSTHVKRDEKGRIQRSAAARHAFARQTGYPNGRPGYVIDHVIPLACGGVHSIDVFELIANLLFRMRARSPPRELS